MFKIPRPLLPQILQNIYAIKSKFQIERVAKKNLQNARRKKNTMFSVQKRPKCNVLLIFHSKLPRKVMGGDVRFVKFHFFIMRAERHLCPYSSCDFFFFFIDHCACTLLDIAAFYSPWGSQVRNNPTLCLVLFSFFTSHSYFPNIVYRYSRVQEEPKWRANAYANR